MSDRYSTVFGVYEITPMAGLPQTAICHGFYVLDGMRGAGYGRKLMDCMLMSLKLENYDYAICTTQHNNTAMKMLLCRAGWIQKDIFQNRKTGQAHTVWGFSISRQVAPGTES